MPSPATFVLQLGPDRLARIRPRRRAPPVRERVHEEQGPDKADDVLRAQGHLKAFKRDMEKARYPKKVRELADLEGRAVGLLMYGNHNLHGVLQTEEYMRALLSTWRPAYSADELERMVAGRMARKAIFDRSPAPELSFVQEEVTLRRPVGDTMVLRRQLEHLLEVANLPFVELHVMPTSRANHPGTGGGIQTLKFGDGTAVGLAFIEQALGEL